MTKGEMEQKYDKLYDDADAIFNELNPCQFRKTEDGKVVCAGSKSIEKYVGKDQTCCHGCKHLGPNGCTVKSLGCKLWTCDHLTEARPDLIQLLDPVRDQASLLPYQLLFVRSPKKECFDALSTNT